MKLKNSRASRLLKTLSKKLRVLFVICLANLATCLRTSATQFSATTSISTLEPITGRKSETAIPRNIDGSRIGKTIRRSRYYAMFHNFAHSPSLLVVRAASRPLLSHLPGPLPAAPSHYKASAFDYSDAQHSQVFPA